MIDLHVHSIFSDGSLTPEAIAEEAARLGLTAVALTDHEGMAGVGRFLAACQAAGIRGVPGVELSVEYKPGTLHMLGYFMNPSDPDLDRILVRIREGRTERNALMLAKLARLGYRLEWDEVAGFAGSDVVGRLHFAQALVARGYARDKDDAFARLLAKGKPAYADRFRLTAEDSIGAIRKAGGVAVLAHPFLTGLHKKGLRKLVEKLAAQGLQGIEAYYSEHDPAQHRACLALAEEFGLAVSGGTDFHGSMNPGLKLGRGFGNLCIPDELVEKLYERRGSL